MPYRDSVANVSFSTSPEPARCTTKPKLCGAIPRPTTEGLKKRKEQFLRCGWLFPVGNLSAAEIFQARHSANPADRNRLLLSDDFIECIYAARGVTSAHPVGLTPERLRTSIEYASGARHTIQLWNELRTWDPSD
eukprot:scaffold17580_cov95-Phaeocystis_antarctica.AAC.8